ncbi:SDR family NAD(P)-dependent oxidoreductase [Cryptosporangium arvum]|uniref:SDR family NAD(P)-dependent oxidoreductase n=1 Tax=Cryptosporangium arvum TaxID=80871 RepID=UPI0004BC5F62|nr:SDR family NAD(P)-dependent oxidoreductase [Cryptosporangium arvum]
MATVFLTGATDGLGRAVAHRLAAEGFDLILHGRDQARLDRVAAEIGGSPRTVRADLSQLSQVRRLAADVSAATDRLDVFISNAGLGSPDPERRVSADGHELHFAVNYLAGFLLARQLLPLLRRSAPARIVFVASLSRARLDFDDLMLERGYSGDRAYGQSKLAQVISGFELAGRTDATEVTVNSLHPATLMPTKMVPAHATIDTLETGVAATVRLATSRELAGVTGRFYDRQRETHADPQAYDDDVRARLWRISEELVSHV